MKPNPTALLIDGDKSIRRLLRSLLESHEYRVIEACNGQSGILTAASGCPDVVILELGLSDMDGRVALKGLREATRSPVLVLSNRSGDADLEGAFDAGAGAFMAKPFFETELLARLRVLQRSLPGEPHEPRLVRNSVSVDLLSHRVHVDGHAVSLTRTEEALFHTLLCHAGEVICSKHLLRSVWGAEAESYGHSLRVFLCNLRRKLEPLKTMVIIETVGTYGYRLLIENLSGFPLGIEQANY